MKWFLVFVGLPLCVLADGGGLPTQPYIYVEGRAEVEKPADMVTLSFDLIGRDPNQAKANKLIQTQAAKILELLKSKNIADEDIEASNLTSEAEYENSDEPAPGKRGKFIGYNVTRPFTVKVRDVAIFPKLVDELLASGIGEFSGISEGLSDEKQLEDQVWDKAVANARDRAEKTLKSVGMKIDSVFAISPVSFPEIQQKIFNTGNERYEYKDVAKSAAPDVSQYRLTPVSVSQRIHVIYLISPAK